MNQRKSKGEHHSKTREVQGRDGGNPGQQATGDELITMPQAIEMLKTTRATFYRWLREGKLKGTKLGRQWRFYRKDIERFLAGKGPRIDLPADIAPLIAELERRLQDTGVGPMRRVGDDPVEHAVRLMIGVAHRSRATDLDITTHMDAGQNEPRTVMRCRIDGVLRVVAEIDTRLLPAIIRFWKGMAGCNVNETKLPQDGRILLRLKKPIADKTDTTLDLRTSFVPAVLGESVTVRILDRGAVVLDLDRIDYAPADRERLSKALSSESGTVIVTGPMGSGKTTVLYACAKSLAGPEVKVISVEEPVEYLLPWVVQMQVNPQVGLTFKHLLRAALRADPNVILVGQIRDEDTLRLIHQSSLTGHLVLTTLHTQDAASALMRMVDMKSDPFVIADATRLILAQRLVRTLCPHCRQAASPAKDSLELLEGMAREGGFQQQGSERCFMDAAGCSRCHQTGYRGRTVIAEALEVTPKIGDAMRDGADAAGIRQIAVSQGMTTMAADGLRRAAAGETTVAEVLRAILR